MPTDFLSRLLRLALAAMLSLVVCLSPSFAEDDKDRKILGGYFEEWSIYYAGLNIANLQQNGVADNLRTCSMRSAT